MKRMILTSILTAAGLFAQATGAQSGSAKTPQTPATKTTVKKQHRKAKKTVKPASSQPKAAVKAPVSK